MPSLKFREVIRILEDHGFTRKKLKATSHAQYEGVVGGKRRLVTVQRGKPNATVKKGTLGSIIRQSGLPKSAFKK